MDVSLNLSIESPFSTYVVFTPPCDNACSRARTRTGGCNAGTGGRSCSAGKASDGYGGGGGGQHANCGDGWGSKNDGGRGVVIVKW